MKIRTGLLYNLCSGIGSAQEINNDIIAFQSWFSYAFIAQICWSKNIYNGFYLLQAIVAVSLKHSKMSAGAGAYKGTVIESQRFFYIIYLRGKNIFPVLYQPVI